jgi:hypothetical protein
MRLLPRAALVLAATAGAALAASCREPTEVSVAISTDVPCDQLRGSSVTVARFSQLEADTTVDAASTFCRPDGDLGALVVVPSGARDGELAFRVVAGVGRPPSECVPPGYGAGCIVARRALKFLPHTSLHVQVPLRAACNGVSCSPDQTCVAGACTSAEIDTARCAGATCDEATLGPPGSGAADAASDAGVAEAGVLDADTVEAGTFTDISAQVVVATSNMVYSRATKLTTGNLTVTNNGVAVAGTIDVALSALTPGVTLSSASGQYQGAPYTTVTKGGLGAGVAATTVVQLSNPSNAAINFTAVTYRE